MVEYVHCVIPGKINKNPPYAIFEFNFFFCFITIAWKFHCVSLIINRRNVIFRIVSYETFNSLISIKNEIFDFFIIILTWGFYRLFLISQFYLHDSASNPFLYENNHRLILKWKTNIIKISIKVKANEFCNDSQAPAL